MICKEKLWGVVVWYNPSGDNLNSAKSYIHDIEKLVIVDNSDGDNSFLLNELYGVDNNIIYIPNFQNRGIATALNQGCRLALESGAEWILTMDQDSHFCKNTVSEFIEKANLYQDLEKVAVFSPVHYYDNDLKNNRKWKEEYTVEDSVMTSGNLLSLKIYNTVGGFRDDFFIDLVDDEYCYRTREFGFLIVVINTILLNHCLGDSSIPVNILGIKRIFDEHKPIRHYYIVRNMLYMKKLYPKYKKRFRKRLRKHFKRVLLYDNRQKWTKLKLMFRAILDYNRNVKGALILKKK